MNVLVKAIQAFRSGELIVKTLRFFVRLTNNYCNKKFWRWRAFQVHEFFVRLRYGQELDVSIFHVSPTLLEAIQRWTSEQKTRKLSDYISKSSRPLITNPLRQAAVQRTDLNEEYYDNFPADLLKNLHCEIRELIKEHNAMKSPVCFVNTRCWLLKRNSDSGGEHQNGGKIHRDGFAPGHLKIMIYFEPLNANNGTLMILGEMLQDVRRGTAVCFQNSKLPHSGIPGKEKSRLAVEITMMRSLVNLEQCWEGHQNGRHFPNPFLAYYLGRKR